MSSETDGDRLTGQVVDTEGTNRGGVVSRAPSRHECSVSSASRAVRVAFSGFRLGRRVWVIYNGGLLTAVVTFLAPSEEDVELFIALSAGVFRAGGTWWGTTEER